MSRSHNLTFRQLYGITENNKKVVGDVVLVSKTLKIFFLSFFVLLSIMVFSGVNYVCASSTSGAILSDLKEGDNYHNDDDFKEEENSSDAVGEELINIERATSLLCQYGYFNFLRKSPVIMYAEDFREVVRAFECRNSSTDERLDGGRIVFFGAKCSDLNSEMGKIKCSYYRESLFENGCNLPAIEGIFQENFDHDHLDDGLCCVMNPRRFIDCAFAGSRAPKCAFIGFCFHCERYLKCIWDGACIMRSDSQHNPNQDLILCAESLLLSGKLGSECIGNFKDISRYGLDYEKYTGARCTSFMGWLGNCLGETFAGIRRFESEAYIDELRCWDYAAKWSDFSFKPICLKTPS